MGYGLMGSALSWSDDGLGEGGPEQKFQGGPSPYFFFLEKFYLLKFFFLGPGGARAPLALYLGPSLISAMAELKDDLSQKQNVVFWKALEQWTKLTIA